MSNRVYLSITAEPAHTDLAPVELAEAENLIPPLWQILLADGQEVAASVDQGVFGDAGAHAV